MWIFGKKTVNRVWILVRRYGSKARDDYLKAQGRLAKQYWWERCCRKQDMNMYIVVYLGVYLVHSKRRRGEAQSELS